MNGSRRYSAVQGPATGFSLVAQPYWTDADQAELNVLIDAFNGVYFIHRERCPTCAEWIERDLSPWCPALSDALEAVLEWRQSRILRSKAAWLRARETLREFEVELGLAPTGVAA